MSVQSTLEERAHLVEELSDRFVQLQLLDEPPVPMNLSLDRYIEGVERTAANLPALLKNWETIDEDLGAEYAEQLSWLLRARPEATAMATTSGRFVEIAQRLAAAVATMWELRAELEAKMGITARQLRSVCPGKLAAFFKTGRT